MQERNLTLAPHFPPLPLVQCSEEEEMGEAVRRGLSRGGGAAPLAHISLKASWSKGPSANPSCPLWGDLPCSSEGGGVRREGHTLQTGKYRHTHRGKQCHSPGPNVPPSARRIKMKPRKGVKVNPPL